MGPEYELTRHNIGFLTLDQLAEEKSAAFEIDRLAYKSLIKYKGRQLHLIKPTTYMNLSGKAINYWLQELKIPTEQLLVVTDDVALPFGKLRLRAKGSNAGHNGLKHIETTLLTTQYARLRFGIGDDYSRGRQVEYVLSRFKSREFEDLPSYIDKAINMVLGFCTIGINRTMTQFND
ncbi:MAG: aminoacyl-tRNA hydrolase [Cyclobacteriaceae bacterium]